MPRRSNAAFYQPKTGSFVQCGVCRAEANSNPGIAIALDLLEDNRAEVRRSWLPGSEAHVGARLISPPFRMRVVNLKASMRSGDAKIELLRLC